MKTIFKYFVLFAILLTVGCSNEKEHIQDRELSDDNVFKGYADAMDKAKGVEQTIHDAA